MSYDNLSSISENFCNFISSLPVKRGGSLSFFDGFHFCHSRVITLDMTERRVFYRFGYGNRLDRCGERGVIS